MSIGPKIPYGLQPSASTVGPFGPSFVFSGEKKNSVGKFFWQKKMSGKKKSVAKNLFLAVGS